METDRTRRQISALICYRGAHTSQGRDRRLRFDDDHWHHHPCIADHSRGEPSNIPAYQADLYSPHGNGFLLSF